MSEGWIVPPWQHPTVLMHDRSKHLVVMEPPENVNQCVK
jgi:hypothetical protein